MVTLLPTDPGPRPVETLRPEPDATGIRRAQLLERLAESADRPLVVLAAPAGFGKTALLRQWAAEDRRAFAWVDLDPRHDDPAALLGAVIGALDEVEPLGRRNSAGRPGLDVVDMLWSLHIGAALATRRVPTVVVLDDVHNVTSPSALGVLGAIFEHLAPRTQLVLAGRSEPPLELIGGTVHDVLRVGAADLALDATEAELLFTSAGASVESDTLEQVMARTECWPMGLALAAATMRDAADVDAVVDAERAAADYFRREVLGSLDEATIEFLTRTSVLDELTGSLCDAVTRRSYSLRALEHLDNANAFLVALDARRRRYRYHVLFREFLRDELRRREPETVPSLHRHAAAWYEQHGRHDQAIKHAIAGEDVDTAARLLWAETGTCIGRGRAAVLRDELGALTDEQLASHPLLTLAAAAVDLAEGRADDAANWLWLTEHGTSDAVPVPDGALGSHVALLRTLLGDAGLARVEADLDRSLGGDDERSPWRALGCFYAGLVRRLAGDVESARARLDEAAVRSAVLWPAIHAASTAELSLLDAEAGCWEEAASRSERGLRYLDERRLGEYPLVAIVPAVAAVTAAHHGDARHARDEIAHAGRLVHALGRVAPALRAEVRVALAWASLQLGDTTGVRQQLKEVRPLVAAMPDALALRDRVAALDADVQAITDTIVGPLALTVAERRVLSYLPMHLSLSEIADRLFVSRNTVKSQAIAIYRKLAVSSRSAAVTRAQDLGLLEE